MDQIASNSRHEAVENFAARSGGHPMARSNSHQDTSLCSYLPKNIKLDFSHFFGPNNFFQPHETPAADCISLAYFHAEELTKLQQTGAVQDYQANFEKLLAKVGPLPQYRQDSDEDVEMEIEGNAEEAIDVTPETSLHAIAGTRAPKNM
ncbi:hypothetical protein U1Q18_020558 [Sarracenia purpurea var. burkii]